MTDDAREIRGSLTVAFAVYAITIGVCVALGGCTSPDVERRLAALEPRRSGSINFGAPDREELDQLGRYVDDLNRRIKALEADDATQLKINAKTLETFSSIHDTIDVVSARIDKNHKAAIGLMMESDNALQEEIHRRPNQAAYEVHSYPFPSANPFPKGIRPLPPEPTPAAQYDDGLHSLLVPEAQK